MFKRLIFMEEERMMRKVEAFLQRKDFSLKNQKLVVGVSGGPDSLALLHFLWSKQQTWNLNIVAAHVDHMFRGAESEEEAYFVKDFCKDREIPFEMKQIDIPLYMKQTGLSSQVAAREGRYAFFKEVMDTLDSPLLALAHHGDDQIETILMRLTRGSTGKARAGIPFLRPYHNGHIIRPFLCLNRADIEEYCSKQRLNPRRDPSNEKEIYSRNRFRKYVLPFLKKENPQVHEHFQRFSEDIEEDEKFLLELANTRLEKAIKSKSDNQVTIDIEAFLTMPLPLQRRGIQLILNYLYKVRPSSLSAIHIDQIFSIIISPHPSGSLDFPSGLKVVRSYNQCFFQFDLAEETQSYEIDIASIGETVLPSGDKIILEFITSEHQVKEDSYTYVAYIEETKLPLRVRTRKNGDRIAIKGMDGMKKVKKLFIDGKVPIHERDRWPIVIDCNDEVIWIPGIKKSKRYQEYTSDSQQKILLTYKRHQED